MYQLFRSLKEVKFLITYLGRFSDEITTMLIDLSNYFLMHENAISKKSTRVSFLIAECFQNVIRYGNIDKKENSDIQNFKEFFQIKFLEHKVLISSSNLIEKCLVKTLDEKIDLINSLDSFELKKLHNKFLVNGKFTSKGGASLGLIDMVRKSGLPIEKSFIDYNKIYDQLFIGIEMSALKNANKNNFIDEVQEEYKKLVNDDVLIVFKGDFSSKTSVVLIEMMQNNLVDKKKKSSKNLKNLFSVIEIIQNISKHGNDLNGYKEGILIFSETKDSLYLEAGNYIKKENAKAFKKYMQKVEKMSIEEINELYLKRLANPVMSTDSNSGLGILEIIRNSKKEYSYNFTEITKNETYYSIKVKLI